MRTIIISIAVLVSTAISAQTTLFQEDFNAGLPTTWVSNFSGNATQTWDTTSNHYGFNFNGSPFIICYDWSGLVTNEEIESPSFSNMSNTTVFLRYDYQFLYQSTALSGYVDVYDGSTWQNVKMYNGIDTYNSTDSLDISSYANPNMKIRFRFENKTGNGWEHDFMIDNIMVIGFSSTEISEFSEKSTHTYPNPVEDFVFVKSNLELQLIELYNVSGRIVKTENNIDLQNKIDLTQLLPGIYFVKVIPKGGLPFTHKIIKK